MPQIELPSELFQKVERSLTNGSTVDDFVRDAVEYRLAVKNRREEFFRLSDIMRAAMHKQGLTEAEILAEFDEFRRSNFNRHIAEFDALCDEIAIAAPGTHLTRDQLHERH